MRLSRRTTYDVRRTTHARRYVVCCVRPVDRPAMHVGISTPYVFCAQPVNFSLILGGIIQTSSQTCPLEPYTPIPVNRIPGKLVHARAFAHERLQHPVSYVGIDMLSRTILKTMYRTISKGRLTTNRDETQQYSGLGQD